MRASSRLHWDDGPEGGPSSGAGCMSVFLPRDIDWGVANWVSFGFLADALLHLDQAPNLAELSGSASTQKWTP